ncbi:MAG TPA: UDP-3-O-(3-hydroxymyristoyl)glucosamine N-acyltransferase, partial [Candidatus Avacidaminococcus intestinavium]|nr:UDP-3-O-(3-hydroxymyristoyl)glucosamine N-acyltransferase [Candidatus Avacidaminococcus intestinavium]
EGTLEAADPELKISGVNGLEEAICGDISFAVPPHIEAAGASQASALVLPIGTDFTGKPIIKVANPRRAFAQLLELFRRPADVERVISERAFIAKDAKIGNNVAIMPFAVVETGAVIGDNTVLYPYAYVGRQVTVGADCTFYPNAVIRDNCVVGNRVILQSGAVIGGDGFGYITEQGKHTKVLQAGNVILGDDVEVGSNTCIDRATAGSTMVGNGTKIDNLVHLGHNDVLGENCLVVAQVGLSGSLTAGNNVTFAGQVGSVGHIKIGNNCVFAARSGITGDVPDNSFYAGFPAVPHREWLKQEATLRSVSKLIKKVKELEKTLQEIKKEN